MRSRSILDMELISNSLIHDDRGWSTRLFELEDSRFQGMKTIDHSFFAFNQKAQTLRGMHYQINGYEETKVVMCALGSIFDVVIDLRPTSKTYLQIYFGKFGPLEKNIGLLVPSGCAHGYLTLADNTAVVYFMDQPHSVQNERGIAWNDPKFKIPWPSEPKVISKRDSNHPNFI